MMDRIGVFGVAAAIASALSSTTVAPSVDFGPPPRRQKGYGSSGNGSQPVPGGGERERQRRLKRMQMQASATMTAEIGGRT